MQPLEAENSLGGTNSYRIEAVAAAAASTSGTTSTSGFRRKQQSAHQAVVKVFTDCPTVINSQMVAILHDLWPLARAAETKDNF